MFTWIIICFALCPREDSTVAKNVQETNCHISPFSFLFFSLLFLSLFFPPSLPLSFSFTSPRTLRIHLSKGVHHYYIIHTFIHTYIHSWDFYSFIFLSINPREMQTTIIYHSRTQNLSHHWTTSWVRSFGWPSRSNFTGKEREVLRTALLNPWVGSGILWIQRNLEAFL